MNLEPIHRIQYNCNSAKWWAGRRAVLLKDFTSEGGIILSKAEQVTIIKKISSGVQMGHTHENSFQVLPSSQQGLIEMPCTVLGLLDC